MLEQLAAFNDAKLKLNRLTAAYLRGEDVAGQIDKAIVEFNVAFASLRLALDQRTNGEPS